MVIHSYIWELITDIKDKGLVEDDMYRRIAKGPCSTKDDVALKDGPTFTNTHHGSDWRALHPAKYEDDIDGIATDYKGPVYADQSILEDLFMTKYLLERIAAQIPQIILLLGAPLTLKLINQEKYRQGVDEIIGVLTDRYPEIRRKYEAWCSCKNLSLIHI